MKRLTTLLLSAALIMGVVSNTYAVDFKAKGYWSYSYEIATNNKFANTKAGASNDDAFSAGTRLRLQLDTIASEALSGTVYLKLAIFIMVRHQRRIFPPAAHWGRMGQLLS